jgi:hypothetical protein
MMKRYTGWMVLGVVLVGMSTAMAQDISKEKARLLARRSAEADAYRKLAEAVYGLQIDSRTFVRDFVAESDEIRTEVDTLVKGVRLGDPVYYEDGSCEVEGEVTVAKVIETLRTAHKKHYRGDSIKVESFTSIERKLEKRVIRAVGMGVPRVDLPADLPPGVEAQLTPVPDTGIKPSIPDLWLRAGPRAKAMATRAARVDAIRKLAERIKGLRLTSRTVVEDFVAQSDEIQTELQATLKTAGEEVGRPYLHNDEYIVEVTMKIPTEQVITTIKTLYSRHYKGDDVKAHQVEDIVKKVVKRDFVATGMGIPPEKYLRPQVMLASTFIPPWSMGYIEATGEGTDETMSTPQGRLRAARAAEVDAKRKLAEEIAGLSLSGGTVVEEFVTERDYIELQVDAVISGARVKETRFEGGRAVVTVVVPGMEVWGVINDAYLRP